MGLHVSHQDSVCKVAAVVRGDYQDKIPHLVLSIKEMKQSDVDIGVVLKDGTGKKKGITEFR